MARMKAKCIKATVECLAMLKQRLEFPKNGYSVPEARKVNKVLDQLENMVSGYQKAVEKIVSEAGLAEAAIRASQSANMMQQLLALESSTNSQVDKVNEEVGAVEAKLLLDEDSYEMVKRQWDRSDVRSSQSHHRATFTKMDDAIQNAKDEEVEAKS